MSLHYTFPPAAGYPLNLCLYRLKSDDAFRERYLADPEATLAEAGLDPERRAALRALSRSFLLWRFSNAGQLSVAFVCTVFGRRPKTFSQADMAIRNGSPTTACYRAADCP